MWKFCSTTRKHSAKKKLGIYLGKEICTNLVEIELALLSPQRWLQNSCGETHTPFSDFKNGSKCSGSQGTLASSAEMLNFISKVWSSLLCPWNRCLKYQIYISVYDWPMKYPKSHSWTNQFYWSECCWLVQREGQKHRHKWKQSIKRSSYNL